MAILDLLRLGAFGTVLLFSIIILGLGAHLINTTLEFARLYFVFNALAIAVACITIVLMTPMLIIDALRKGAYTSRVAFELKWVGILWVLWLAGAADIASTGYSGNCGDFFNSIVQRACSESQAIEAFLFLGWIILLAYFVVILVLATMAHQRGEKHVWNTSVRDGPMRFHGGGGASSTQPQMSNTTTASQYQQQHTQPQMTGTTTYSHSNAPSSSYGGYPPQQHAGYPQGSPHPGTAEV